MTKKVTKDFLKKVEGISEDAIKEILEYQEDKKYTFLNFTGTRKEVDNFVDNFKKENQFFRVHESEVFKMSHLKKVGYHYKTQDEYYYFFLLENVKEISYFSENMRKEKIVEIIKNALVNNENIYIKENEYIEDIISDTDIITIKVDVDFIDSNVKDSLKSKRSIYSINEKLINNNKKFERFINIFFENNKQIDKLSFYLDNFGVRND